MNLKNYKRAAFPAVAIETVEEGRLLGVIKAQFSGAEIVSIAAVGGLKSVSENKVIDARAAYPQAWGYACDHPGCICVAYDFQHVIRNAGAYRPLKDSLGVLKALRPSSMIVLVSPAWAISDELKHEIPVLQFGLPTRAELGEALKVVADGASVKVGEADPLLDAAAGLSLGEAENAFALSLVQDKRLNPLTVEGEKMRLVRSSGFLEVSAPAPADSVGGLQNLKDYVSGQIIPSMHDDVLRVKGLMLVGVPGTGKSLAARAMGSMLGWPVVRMDVASLKAGIVGASESNLRQALKLVDAIAPCVLWCDEIEKAVGGYASSAQTDSGVTLGMVGQLLNWLQEHTSAVITVMTCNDFAKLPPELSRAGRIDEMFFVDLPSASERAEIARVHLNRYADKPNGQCDVVAKISEGWTGAEIEQCIKVAARATSRAITDESLQAAAATIRPISRVRGDEIKALREWAKDRLRIANTVDKVSKSESGRSVEGE
jgi:hypothetical protein